MEERKLYCYTDPSNGKVYKYEGHNISEILSVIPNLGLSVSLAIRILEESNLLN